MDFLNLFFSFKGRIGRGPYFVGNVLINLLNLPERLISGFYTGEGHEPPAVLTLGFGLLSLVLLWPTAAVLVKRGHDRGRPAWWSIGVLAAAVIAIGVFYATKSPAAILVAAVIVVYQIVDYLCMPESPRAKKYNVGRTDAQTAQVFS